MTVATKLTCVAVLLCFAQGFQPSPRKTYNAPVVTSLEARRVKKNPLGSLAEDGIISTPKKASKASTSKKPLDGDISSDLAKWAASQEDDDVDDGESTRRDAQTSIKSSKGTTGQPNPDNPEVRQIVQELQDELEQKKNNLDTILSLIQKLVQFESSTPLKVLTAGSASSSGSLNYRLAWVGSDAAICHIGTSQHKVPLARLKEIFLILEGRNRILLYEVISVLGPFPNIRNTLKGSCQVTGTDPYNWKIVYDSMIDGLGKELLADKEGNKQHVDLQVYFCDGNAVVAVIPPTDGTAQSDPLRLNGANVLVFVREDDMDSKLDAMRVL